MTPHEFLTELASMLGGAVDDESALGIQTPDSSETGRSPRLLGQRTGFYVKVDFVVPQELLLEVNTEPPYHLLVRRKTFVGRLLGSVGISGGRRSGDVAFDRKYSILYLPQELTAKALSPDFRALVEKLEPLIELRMTHKDYGCLKPVDLRSYSAGDALRDLDVLIELVNLTRDTAP